MVKLIKMDRCQTTLSRDGRRKRRLTTIGWSQNTYTFSEIRELHVLGPLVKEHRSNQSAAQAAYQSRGDRPQLLKLKLEGLPVESSVL